MEKEREITRVPQFDGSNYSSWKFHLHVVLEEHELTECIMAELEELEEYVVKPEDTNVLKEQKKNATEKRKKTDPPDCQIARIHDSQLEFIQDKPTPKEIWLTLQ